MRIIFFEAGFDNFFKNHNYFQNINIKVNDIHSFKLQIMDTIQIQSHYIVAIQSKVAKNKNDESLSKLTTFMLIA